MSSSSRLSLTIDSSTRYKNIVISLSVALLIFKPLNRSALESNSPNSTFRVADIDIYISILGSILFRDIELSTNLFNYGRLSYLVKLR